jgi:hypothetical protein
MKRKDKTSSLSEENDVFELRNLVGPLRHVGRYQVSLSPDIPTSNSVYEGEQQDLPGARAKNTRGRLVISEESKETPRIDPTPAKSKDQNGNKWKKRKIMTTNFKNNINERIEDILKGLELFDQNLLQNKGMVAEKKPGQILHMKTSRKDRDDSLNIAMQKKLGSEFLEAEESFKKQLSLNENDLRREIETKQQLELVLSQKRKEIEDLGLQKLAIEKELLETYKYKKEKEGQLIQYESKNQRELSMVNEEKERMKQLVERLREEYANSEQTRQNILKAFLDIATQPITLCRLYRSNLVGANSEFVSSDRTNTLRLLPDTEHGTTNAKHQYIFNRLYNENTTSKEISEALTEYLCPVLEGTNSSLISISAEPVETLGSPSRTYQRFQSLLSLHLLDWMFQTVETRKQLDQWKSKQEVYISCVGIVNEKLHDLLVLDYDCYSPVRPQFNKGKGDWERASLHVIAGRDSLGSLLNEACETYAELLDDQVAQNCLHQLVLRLAVPKPECQAGYAFLTLVDVAGVGSEELPRRPVGDPLLEKSDRLSRKQASIVKHRPLTALQRVIRGLRRQKGEAGREEVLPFRDCLLTRLLQDCMGGKTQSVVLANVDLAADSYAQVQLLMATTTLGNT